MWGRREFVAAATLAGLAPGAGWATELKGHPVLVELFTSQGCHSCPPADTFLGELAGRQEVIALGYHIDYWDYIGWKDPFADPLYTTRQRGYAAALGNRTIYTPQMVIDGRTDRVGSRRGEVEMAIRRFAEANQADRISVPISLRRAAEAITVALPPAAVPATGEVLIAATLDAHTTSVKRGENAGRTLTDFSVVRLLATVGRYDGKAARWTVDRAALPADADRIAVWLQAPDLGPVWGAAQISLAPQG